MRGGYCDFDFDLCLIVVCGASHSAVCLYLNTPQVGPLLKQVVLVDVGPLTNCQNLPLGPGSPQMESVSTVELGAVSRQSEVAL